jgi:isopenicillin-N N-acyltransferase like protein
MFGLVWEERTMTTEREAAARPVYPTVRVTGSPRQRGRQYGEEARERIAMSRAGYEEAFGHAAGWTWHQAVEAAAVFGPEVEAAFPDYAEEMRGIAEGAALRYADVLTLNARTEVIWAATARQAASQRARFAAECTAFALLAERTANGHPMIGQNWDWLVLGFDTLVVLEVEQPEAPNFVTVVEAGLLAKASMNSAGVAVVTNALVSSADVGAPGIPYHVMLRALADCETMTEGVGAVVGNVRASSANYLLATADDLAIDLEAAPGDYRTVEALLPTNGALLHTNHFLRPLHGAADVSVYAMPDSLVRYQRAQPVLGGIAGRGDLGSVTAALRDHADFPSSVCSHPDPRDDVQQWATVMSLVMDPVDRRMWLASGNPCQRDFVELDVRALLSKPSRLAKHRAAV